jgi:peptidylprolyl isomerase
VFQFISIGGISLKLKYFLLVSLMLVLLAYSDTARTESIPTAPERNIKESSLKESSLETAAWEPASAFATTGDAPQTTASGLQYVIVKEGDGQAPRIGELVEVHYTGALADGSQFASSYDRGKPLKFTLGTGEVFPGWDEGMSLLKEGGQAKLIVPPELGYGSRGSGQVIPPNATLYLEVELLAVRPNGPLAPAEVFEADYITTPSGLKYYDFAPGSGDSPQPGQTITVHYTGWFENETMFDSSRLRDQPFSFVLGQGKVIAGWEEGLASMKVGGKRQLLIPPELAYGQEGAGGGAIPPNASLIFEVEALAIK